MNPLSKKLRLRATHFQVSSLDASLHKESANNIDTLEAVVRDRDQLVENMAITIGAIVVAAGGKVEVPNSVLEDIQKIEVEKAPRVDGGVIYRTRKRQEAKHD